MISSACLTWPDFCGGRQGGGSRGMSAKSLWKVLKSKKEGQVDPNRDAVVTGRERHAYSSRPGYLPYPQRAIRTKDFQFVINFKPDRWPWGTPICSILEGTRHGSAGKPNLRDLGRRGCRADQGMDRDEPQGPKVKPFSIMPTASVPARSSRREKGSGPNEEPRK